MIDTYQKTSTLLKADGITKSYGNKLIIRNISFEIKDIVVPGRTQGQIISLCGRSGVGKSTLFRILAALEQPSSGTVMINSDIPNVLKSVHEGNMGIVFQNYIMFDDLTVKQNFEVAIKFNPNSDNIDRKAFIEVYAKEFSLSEHLDKYPCQLSGGQRQRASIIMQVLNGSNFLLLDEPFSGLDSIMIDKLLNVLVRIADTQELQTIIIISHDLENCLAISDTVFVVGLEDGKEGAIIKKEIDLIERGLAWHEDVKDLPEFRETIKEVKSLL